MRAQARQGAAGSRAPPVAYVFKSFRKSFDNSRKGNGGSTAHSLVVCPSRVGVAMASLTLTCVAPRPPHPVLSHGDAR